MTDLVGYVHSILPGIRIQKLFDIRELSKPMMIDLDFYIAAGKRQATAYDPGLDRPLS
jgi:hypothetical protein